MDVLAVEVLGENDLYYKAHLLDLLPDEAVVQFEKSLKTSRVQFSNVRLAPDPSTEKPSFKEGDEGEVCHLCPSENTFAWFPVSIRFVKGDFAVVDYLNVLLHMNEIVKVDDIRLPNNTPCLTPTSFNRLTIDVPADLHSICQDEANHREFKERCGAAFVKFNNESHCITVLSRDPSVIKKASLLSDIHLRSLRQKMTLLQLTEESAKKLQITRQQPAQSPCREVFFVPRNLISYAFGMHNSNIQLARQVPGVHAVDFNEDTATFTISGETVEAVASARSILEYAEETIQIPRDLASRIIGKEGSNIQDIVDRSGAIRVTIKGDKEQEAHEEGFIPFVFIGTVESIENAKLLLDYHINHLREVIKLTRQKQQLDEELSNLTKSSTVDYFQKRQARFNNRDDRDGSRRGPAQNGWTQTRISSPKKPASNGIKQNVDESLMGQKIHETQEEKSSSATRLNNGTSKRPVTNQDGSVS